MYLQRPAHVLSLLLSLFICICLSWAQLQLPYSPSPFNSIGRIQDATVTDPSDVLSGGTLRVNDITITIPRNLLVTLPSITVSWAELFNTDGTLNLPNLSYGWEASVTANRVGAQHIAGIIYIFQQLLHTSSGFITAIDYVLGELRVGGDLADSSSGTRVIINDPVGRFGLVHDQWPLFTADTENPSVRAHTGFPVCVPRVDPASADDPLCPRKNRPVNSAGQALSIVDFPAVPTAGQPDARFAAPLLRGDWVTFEAVNVGGDLWAAYGLAANLGLYTAAGSSPVYLTIDVAQWGIVGSREGEVAETRIQGYTTDETQNVEVFAVDVDPCTGIRTERVLGIVVPRPGGRRGQWRYRPDADIAGATREVGARVLAGAVSTGNGLAAGQFVQPVMDGGFIFPELTVFGRPQIVNEFNLLRHLAHGVGQWLGGVPGGVRDQDGPVVAQLDPWPGAVAPPGPGCTDTSPPQIPRANAGPDQTVVPGTAVILKGSSDTSNLPEDTIVYRWEQVLGAGGGGGPVVALTGADTRTAGFTAPTEASLTFKLTTSNAVGASNDQVVVKVAAVITERDIITIVAWEASNSKGVGQLNVQARSSVLDGSTQLTVEATDPDLAPTAMQYSGRGDGMFTILVGMRKPESFTVRSLRGSSVTIVV